MPIILSVWKSIAHELALTLSEILVHKYLYKSSELMIDCRLVIFLKNHVNLWNVPPINNKWNELNRTTNKFLMSIVIQFFFCYFWPNFFIRVSESEKKHIKLRSWARSWLHNYISRKKIEIQSSDYIEKTIAIHFYSL